MIVLREHKDTAVSVVLTAETEQVCKLAELFSGKYLSNYWKEENGELTLKLGIGKKEELTRIRAKEIGAKAAAQMQEKKVAVWSMDLSPLMEVQDGEYFSDVIEGLVLGAYEQPCFKSEEKKEEQTEIHLYGAGKDMEKCLEAALCVAESVRFARDLTNLPGNFLRPYDFADKVMEELKDLPLTCECIRHEQVRALGLNGLEAVGGSSENPPCMLVIRYQGAEKDDAVLGLVGKGLTYDTGGYCLKPGKGMDEMRGDMGGGAAVAGAMRALAKNRVRANVTAVIPMCENRISAGSLLPGDIYTSYSGKTVQVLNTDAEGRLILADGVSYVIRKEKAERVVDIATLTGAVVHALGTTIAGTVCDNDEFYREFEQAAEKSGERYLRLPFFEEHTKMIETPVADVKNTGAANCGAITAGLFVRTFAEEKPWLHMDIAGTAWVDSPDFAFQSKGATGAGVTTLYYLCKREER